MKTNRKELFEARFKKYYPRLCSIACGYLSEAEACEDVVQESFISVWDKGKDVLPEAEFYAYMVRCVRNGCVSSLRRDKRLHTLSIENVQADSEELWSDNQEHHKNALSPEEHLNEILKILPERCREIFLMSKLQMMKYRDIANKLDISEKTVENQMGKALRLLRSYAMTHSLQIPTVLLLLQLFISNKWK